MLNRNQYFIKEQVEFVKLSGKYDVFDPDTNAKIGEIREEISGLVKTLRLLVSKKLMPTKFAVYDTPDAVQRTLLFSLKRGVALLRPKIEILDNRGQPIGYLQAKLISLGGAFKVFMADGTEIAMVKGDWKGWNFKFLSGDVELGVVTKKWAGLAKEMFTSADNYMISIHGENDPNMSILLLASGIAIDTVYKEQNQ